MTRGQTTRCPVQRAVPLASMVRSSESDPEKSSGSVAPMLTTAWPWIAH